MQPNFDHIVMHFPDGTNSRVKELVTFEPEDRSVGIFGCFIVVKDDKDREWILNDGRNWIHPFKEEDEPDWQTIAGTFSGELWPEIDPKITAREILACSPNHSFQEDSQAEERLELRFGIDLDTELEVS